MKREEVKKKYKENYFYPPKILDSRFLYLIQKIGIFLYAKFKRGFGIVRIIKFLSTIKLLKKYVKVIGPDGFNFFINLENGNSTFLFGFGIAEIAPLLSYLPPESMVFDIGANMGIWTRVFNEYFSSGNIFAFEPSPSAYKDLKKNSEHFDINCSNFAISDTDGEVFFSLENGTALHHITKEKNKYTIPIKSKKLDNWALDKNLKRVDFLKIDVEGHEFEVLLGAKKIIETFRPIILFEYIDFFVKDRTTKKDESIFDYFTKIGYSVFRVSKNGFVYENMEENYYPDWTNDYVAFDKNNLNEDLKNNIFKYK